MELWRLNIVSSVDQFFFYIKNYFLSTSKRSYKKFLVFCNFQSINHNEIYILACLRSPLHETLLVFSDSASFGFCSHLNWFCLLLVRVPGQIYQMLNLEGGSLKFTNWFVSRIFFLSSGFSH